MDAADQQYRAARIGGRPRICTLIAGSSTPAPIRTLSARFAELQTAQRLPLGAAIALVHPIGGRV